MALESGVTYIEDLVSTNPVGATDDVAEGDDHIRNIKTAVQGSFPNLGAGGVTRTAAEINDLITIDGAETLTNKTLTSPVINTPDINGGTIDGAAIAGYMPIADVVVDYGATGDGVTDDTVAIQAGIDALTALGGGTLFFPKGQYVCEGVVPKNHVFMKGENIGLLSKKTSLGTPLQGSELIAEGSGGNIIDHTSGQLVNFGMEGLLLTGAGAGTACIGINILFGERFNFRDLSFDSFADQAILIADSTTGYIENCFAQGCLLNRTRSEKNGVIELSGTDCVIRNNEVTASLPNPSGKSSVNLYCCAFAFKDNTGGGGTGGGTHTVIGNIAEISDIGFYLECNDSRFSNNRADLNQGHGYELVGAGGNQFSNELSFRNSWDTTNTYDQWSIDSSSNRNIFSNCQGQALTVDAWKARYSFNDAVNGDDTKNFYSNCIGRLAATGDWNTVAFAGSAVGFISGAAKAFTAADATPSVSQYGHFKTVDTTTYTNFDDGISGQEIKILAADAATLGNNATIKTNTGGNKIMTANIVYTLTNFDGVWYESA